MNLYTRDITEGWSSITMLSAQTNIQLKEGNAKRQIVFPQGD